MELALGAAMIIKTIKSFQAGSQWIRTTIKWCSRTQKQINYGQITMLLKLIDSSWLCLSMAKQLFEKKYGTQTDLELHLEEDYLFETFALLLNSIEALKQMDTNYIKSKIPSPSYKTKRELLITKIKYEGDVLHKLLVSKKELLNTYSDILLMEQTQIQFKQQIENNNVNDSSEDDEIECAWKCEECFPIQYYKSKRNLESHQSSKHIGFCKQYFCHVCNKRFQSKSKLDSHGRKHKVTLEKSKKVDYTEGVTCLICKKIHYQKQRLLACNHK
eukprot:324737_1